MAYTNIVQIRKHESDSALDRRAQLTAKKAGYRAIKSIQQESYDNQGGYMLIDPRLDMLVAGFRFDLTAREVIVDLHPKLTHLAP